MQSEVHLTHQLVDPRQTSGQQHAFCESVLGLTKAFLEGSSAGLEG